MTAETFNAVLTEMLDRRPFQVFTVEMNSGRRFEVDGPKTVVLRAGVAVYVAHGGYPVYFDHESVHSFIDATAGADLDRAE
jgi:hypothetical protein